MKDLLFKRLQQILCSLINRLIGVSNVTKGWGLGKIHQMRMWHIYQSYIICVEYIIGNFVIVIFSKLMYEMIQFYRKVYILKTACDQQIRHVLQFFASD